MSSTLYTIGTALRRAQENQRDVAVLVESHWLEGRVAALDGYGVLLDLEAECEHSVVRLESISAVRVHDALPAEPRSDDSEDASQRPAHATLQPV
jgi:hypothetical protein